MTLQRLVAQRYLDKRGIRFTTLMRGVLKRKRTVSANQSSSLARRTIKFGKNVNKGGRNRARAIVRTGYLGSGCESRRLIVRGKVERSNRLSKGPKVTEMRPLRTSQNRPFPNWSIFVVVI